MTCKDVKSLLLEKVKVDELSDFYNVSSKFVCFKKRYLAKRILCGVDY